jgi:hypothetical protein
MSFGWDFSKFVSKLFYLCSKLYIVEFESCSCDARVSALVVDLEFPCFQVEIVIFRKGNHKLCVILILHLLFVGKFNFLALETLPCIKVRYALV